MNFKRLLFIFLGLAFTFLIGSDVICRFFVSILLKNITLPSLGGFAEILFAAAVGFVLAHVLVNNFDWQYAKKLPLGKKLLLLYLLLHLIEVAWPLFAALLPLNPNYFLSKALFMLFCSPLVFYSLLLTSIIFLLVERKYGFLFSSSFFLLLLLNPYTASGSTIFSGYGEAAVGTLISAIHFLRIGDMTLALTSIIASLFPISAITYIFLNKFKPNKYVEWVLSGLIVLFFFIGRYWPRFHL
jgi:hypothetical protein